MRRGWPASIGLCLTLAGLLAACGPEAGRVREGGPGGDIGNRTASVQIHAGNESLYGVPLIRGPGEK